MVQILLTLKRIGVLGLMMKNNHHKVGAQVEIKCLNEAYS